MYKGAGTESLVVKEEGTGSEGNGNREMKAGVKKIHVGVRSKSKLVGGSRNRGSTGEEAGTSARERFSSRIC